MARGRPFFDNWQEVSASKNHVLPVPISQNKSLDMSRDLSYRKGSLYGAFAPDVFVDSAWKTIVKKTIPFILLGFIGKR